MVQDQVNSTASGFVHSKGAIKSTRVFNISHQRKPTNVLYPVSSVTPDPRDKSVLQYSTREESDVTNEHIEEKHVRRSNLDSNIWRLVLRVHRLVSALSRRTRRTTS